VADELMFLRQTNI